MKKSLVLAIIFTLLTTLSLSNTAFAKKNKKEQNFENQRIEYLNFDWWNRFNDEILSKYMHDLYEKNHDLKIATLKVRENEKIVKLSFANELPQISFDGSFRRIMTSSEEHKGPTHVYEPYSQSHFFMPLTASYEIDIWGENRFKTKSIGEQLKITQQNERASYIALTSSFASDYFNLIKTNKFVDLQNKLVLLQQEIVEKTEKKLEVGLCNENDVINERKLLTFFTEELNNLLKTRTMLENQLKVYLAMTDGIVETNEYEKVNIIENIPEFLASSVIDKRPDYINCENYIKKIGYDVKVARREMLPKIVIYGQLGLSSYDWGNIFKTSSQLANAGIIPTIDIFSGGRKLNMLRLKKYQYDEAVEHYQRTILTSIQEVNNSLAELQTANKNYQQSKERNNLENRKHKLMSKKEEIGSASALDVLYSEEKELISQKDEISAKINHIIATIGLYKAIGGQDLYNVEKPQKENI